MQISQDTINKLKAAFISDITKPEISVLDRAIMLKEYMDANDLTYRSFSKKFNFPKTNIHEWLLPLKVPAEEKSKITSSTKLADVYTMLGKDRLKEKKVENMDFDYDLTAAIYKFEKYIGKVKSHNGTRDKVVRLRNILGEILSGI